MFKFLFVILTVLLISSTGTFVFAEIIDVANGASLISGNVQDDLGLPINNQKIGLYEITPGNTNGTLISSVFTGPDNEFSYVTGDGEYMFAFIPPGSYKIAQIDIPSGMVQTFPANLQPYFVEVVNTAHHDNNNFIDEAVPTSYVEGFVG